jgi:phage shock protein PspC (stress-responsive transcriptional regulator)
MTENQTTPEPDAPTGYAGTPGTGPETPAGGPGTSSGGTGSGATPPPPGPAATPPYPPRRPPLRRSRNDRVLTGVCGGFAENLGVDATLIRILVVVATVFSGGALLIAYVVAWALMPDTPLQPVAVYVTPQSGQASQPEPALAGVAGAAAAGATTAYPTVAYPTSYAAGGTGTYVDPQTGTVYGSPAYTPPPRRTEPRSYLGLITLSAAIVVGGLFALAGALGAEVSGLVVSASLLLVLGVGLLVGAWRGRARWLIVPALIMVLVVQGIAAVNNVVEGAGSGVGERTWTPTSSDSSFNLGAGSARLDLSDLPAGDATVKVSLGLGELIVLVPPGTAVELTGSVGAGEVDLPGQRPVSGTDLKLEKTVDAVGAAGTTTTVELDAQVGLGQLEVRRAAS